MSPQEIINFHERYWNKESETYSYMNVDEDLVRKENQAKILAHKALQSIRTSSNPLVQDLQEFLRKLPDHGLLYRYSKVFYFIKEYSDEDQFNIFLTGIHL